MTLIKPSSTVLMFLVLSLLQVVSLGQDRAPSRPPAFAPPVNSPEVLADRRVTFRLRAPNAKEVMLSRDGASPIPMKKDEQGVWSLTTDPLAPDIYSYTYVVDGVVLPDSMNPSVKSVYKIFLGQSLVHIPGPSTLSWEINDVPHGTVNHHFYKSTIIGDDRDYYVYTPPNYDARRKEPYPVLFLLHGYSDDASAWITTGRANVILDNLIAQGKAKPMLIVNTLGYGAPEIIIGGFGGPGLRDPAVVRRNNDNYVAALLQEVMPRIEKDYNARSDRHGRAITGLSMGGAQALDAGLNHLDKFAYVGGFSSAVMLLNQDPSKAFPTLDVKTNSQLRLLWIACGTDDFLLDANRKFEDWLTAKGIKFTRIETPGGHTWMVWRRNLTEFVPLLFPSKSK